MTQADLLVLMPLIVLSVSVIIALVLMSFYRGHRLVAAVAVIAFLSAFALLFISGLATGEGRSLLIVFDGYARYFSGLFFLASAAIVLLSAAYFGRNNSDRQPLYLLFLLATTGAAVLAASGNFATLFLGLEIMSISLYALIAYFRDSRHSIEAGLKYLILAAVSSAFLLFGIALIYAETGSFDFNIALGLFEVKSRNAALLYGAIALLIVGFGFKLGSVPFHLWTPDVYEGSPAPVTSYLAVVSKGAVLAVLFRLLCIIQPDRHGTIMISIIILSAASMLTGNILALRQNNVKRILAYSSISHIGYLLIALAAGRSLALEAVALYIAAYAAATIGIFGVVSACSGDGFEADSISIYRGLFWKRPFLAAVFTISLLSLAGIPLTGGFWAKYYIAMAGLEANLWPMVLLLVVNSVISLYYYLRIVSVLYGRTTEADEVTAAAALSYEEGAVLFLSAAALAWIGVYPAHIMNLIRAIM